jgi:hypothetical protein
VIEIIPVVNALVAKVMDGKHRSGPGETAAAFGKFEKNRRQGGGPVVGVEYVRIPGDFFTKLKSGTAKKAETPGVIQKIRLCWDAVNTVTAKEFFVFNKINFHRVVFERSRQDGIVNGALFLAAPNGHPHGAVKQFEP